MRYLVFTPIDGDDSRATIPNAVILSHFISSHFISSHLISSHLALLGTQVLYDFPSVADKLFERSPAITAIRTHTKPRAWKVPALVHSYS